MSIKISDKANLILKKAVLNTPKLYISSLADLIIKDFADEKLNNTERAMLEDAKESLQKESRHEH